MIVTVIWEGHPTGHRYRVSGSGGGNYEQRFKNQWDTVNHALSLVMDGAHQAEDVIEVLEKAWVIEKIEEDQELTVEVELT